jgi:hypothetical protein
MSKSSLRKWLEISDVLTPEGLAASEIKDVLA